MKKLNGTHSRLVVKKIKQIYTTINHMNVKRKLKCPEKISLVQVCDTS